MEIINSGSESHRDILIKFGNFIEADSIEYKDYGINEDYIIYKNDQKFILSARGNKYDGSYLVFSNKNL